MIAGALGAASAYGRALDLSRVAQPTTESEGASGSQGTASFGAMVEGLFTNAASKMHGAETASAAQVAGKGDLIDVVTAVSAAEQALDTVVAVRDKVISAYSDIMRMQI